MNFQHIASKMQVEASVFPADCPCTTPEVCNLSMPFFTVDLDFKATIKNSLLLFAWWRRRGITNCNRQAQGLPVDPCRSHKLLACPTPNGILVCLKGLMLAELSAAGKRTAKESDPCCLQELGCAKGKGQQSVYCCLAFRAGTVLHSELPAQCIKQPRESS